MTQAYEYVRVFIVPDNGTFTCRFKRVGEAPSFFEGTYTPGLNVVEIVVNELGCDRGDVRTVL